MSAVTIRKSLSRVDNGVTVKSVTGSTGYGGILFTYINHGGSYQLEYYDPGMQSDIEQKDIPVQVNSDVFSAIFREIE